MTVGFESFREGKSGGHGETLRRNGGIANLSAAPTAVDAAAAVLSSNGLAVSSSLELSRDLTQRRRVDLKTGKGECSRFDAGAEELW